MNVLLCNQTQSCCLVLSFHFGNTLQHDKLYKDIGRYLTQCHDFQYRDGDCLFDCIAYLLEYSYNSEDVRHAIIDSFKLALTMQWPTATTCLTTFLQEEILVDLHHIQNCNQYLEYMRRPATRGGLWGDHFCLYWFSKYFPCTISVWSYKAQKEYIAYHGPKDSQVLTLLYHDYLNKAGHFEPLYKQLKKKINQTSKDNTIEIHKKNRKEIEPDTIFNSVSLLLQGTYSPQRVREIVVNTYSKTLQDNIIEFKQLTHQILNTMSNQLITRPKNVKEYLDLLEKPGTLGGLKGEFQILSSIAKGLSINIFVQDGKTCSELINTALLASTTIVLEYFEQNNESSF